MKFDVAVMNPPYSRTLHLDILEKVIPHANEVINISPTSHLYDMTAIFNLKKNTTWHRYKDSVSKHIMRVNRVHRQDANESFNIASFTDIDILALDNRESDLYKHIYEFDVMKSYDVFEKVIDEHCFKQDKNIKSMFNKEESKAFFLRLSDIHGHPGCKDEFDICSSKLDLLTEEGQQNKVYFDSKEELKNFHKSLQTSFMKYCNYLSRQGQHVHYEFLPWMGDYKDTWDDKRFFEFFKLEEKDIAKIKEFGEIYNKKESRALF